MTIRLNVTMSLVAAAVIVGGCAGKEESRPMSSPSMKEIPSARETMPTKMRDTTPSPMIKETSPAPAAITKEPAPSAPTRMAPSVTETRTVISSDPLQACLDAISKGASPGQRAIAELTCQRDYGKGDSRTVASGTQGDSYQSCLARIPKDASAGQRMLAEESCRRDEEGRKGF